MPGITCPTGTYTRVRKPSLATAPRSSSAIPKSVWNSTSPRPPARRPDRGLRNRSRVRDRTWRRCRAPAAGRCSAQLASVAAFPRIPAPATSSGRRRSLLLPVSALTSLTLKGALLRQRPQTRDVVRRILQVRLRSRVAERRELRFQQHVANTACTRSLYGTFHTDVDKAPFHIDQQWSQLPRTAAPTSVGAAGSNCNTAPKAIEMLTRGAGPHLAWPRASPCSIRKAPYRSGSVTSASKRRLSQQVHRVSPPSSASSAAAAPRLRLSAMNLCAIAYTLPRTTCDTAGQTAAPRQAEPIRTKPGRPPEYCWIWSATARPTQCRQHVPRSADARSGPLVANPAIALPLTRSASALRRSTASSSRRSPPPLRSSASAMR
jgi:hypothetical protein